MKDVLKSLKDNATSRLRNPVGAFVLSWCALNINGLATFILSSNFEKLKIISHKSWLLTEDVLFPLAIAFVYLLLLPLLNLAYEYVSEGVINKMREKHKNTTDTARFQLLKSTVAAKIEADEEYIRKLKDQQIEGWLEEQSKRNKEFINQKQKYSTLLVSHNEKEQQFATARSELLQDIKDVEFKLPSLEAESVSKLTY
ncbi:hypothetical protein HRJ46_17590, partial [Vibrio coralliilyticus]